MLYEKTTLAQIDDQHGVLWRFDTLRYSVAFWPMDEDSDPADSFEIEEDIAFARSGNPAHWFCAVVGVFKRDEESADVVSGMPTDEDFVLVDYDTLGGCSYRSFKEFVEGHRDRDPLNRNCSLMRAQRGDNVVIGRYFPTMVREAHYFPTMVREAIARVRRNVTNGRCVR